MNRDEAVKLLMRGWGGQALQPADRTPSVNEGVRRRRISVAATWRVPRSKRAPLRCGDLEFQALPGDQNRLA
jgi:hypothetical protein